jgi:hypothetical protein
MHFLEHELGHRNAGDLVEVSLRGNAANVRLMDSSNLESYKRSRDYRFYGGWPSNRQSTCKSRIRVTGTSSWTCTAWAAMSAPPSGCCLAVRESDRHDRLLKDTHRLARCALRNVRLQHLAIRKLCFHAENIGDPVF